MDTSIKTKKCSCCGRELPVTEFYRNKSKPDGVGTYCKECQKKMSSDYYFLSRVKKANAEHEKKGKANQVNNSVVKNLAPTDANAMPNTLISDHEPKKERTLNDYQPRELIKYLYKLGYRIEDNMLVCYTKQIVNLKDVING